MNLHEAIENVRHPGTFEVHDAAGLALADAVERVRRAANATFDDPMVSPASAATAERILRALDGREA